MEARFNDGLTAQSHVIDVRLEGEALVFEAGGERRWPLDVAEIEQLDDRVRVAPDRSDPARLTMAADDWRALTGQDGGHYRARQRRELRLVATLAGAAAAIAAIIFVGIPAIAGPLARATPPRLESRIGANLEAQVSLAFPACGGQPGQVALDRFGARLEQAAHTPFDIKVRAVHAPMVNAFALPGGRILVTDQLIALAATPDELAAVVAHEAAHVEKRHVMQGVWRSFGFGVVLDAVVGGGTGAGQQAVLLMGSFTNLRFGRKAEAQADAVGQDLLQAEGLSSEGMALFFQRLASKAEGQDAEAVKELLSDHPDTLRRAQTSRARAKPGAVAFSPAEWASIKASCKDGHDRLRRLRKLF